jgi:hypothetical protein
LSATQFSNLPLGEAMLGNLDTLGYHQMSEVQAQSLPLVLVAKDVTGAIVGTVSLKSTSLAAKDEDYAPWLDDLYVIPAHRENGTRLSINANKAHLFTHVLTGLPAHAGYLTRTRASV